MQVRKGGSWRSVTSAQAYINGAWRQILYGQCYKSGKWRNVVNFTTSTGGGTTTGLTVSLSANSIRSTSNATTITCAPVTATPSGGKSPYTYTWAFTAQDGNAFVINSPTSASTTVTVTGLGAGLDATCSIACTVKDSTGLSATSSACSLTFFNEGSGAIP